MKTPYRTPYVFPKQTEEPVEPKPKRDYSGIKMLFALVGIWVLGASLFFGCLWLLSISNPSSPLYWLGSTPS